MKPGSSWRCTSKHDGRRCNQGIAHLSTHTARKGKVTVTWA